MVSLLVFTCSYILWISPVFGFFGIPFISPPTIQSPVFPVPVFPAPDQQDPVDIPTVQFPSVQDPVINVPLVTNPPAPTTTARPCVSNSDCNTLDTCDQQYDCVNMECVIRACRQGWRNLNGRCYLIVRDRVTWVDSWDLCEIYGGTLLSVNDEAEFDAVAAVLPRPDVDNTFRFWTTANKLVNERCYTDGFSEKPPGFLLFASDLANSGDCLFLRVRNNMPVDFQLNDCISDIRQFVCEAPENM